MKDAYTFDLDTAGLDVSFERMRAAYERIFARCAVEALPAQASSGAMGGRESIEFVVATPAGEDHVVRCNACAYVANVEVACSRIPTLHDAHATLEEFCDAWLVTIDALSAEPFNVPPGRQLKTPCMWRMASLWSLSCAAITS